jgi:hypothetical protein
MGKETAPAAIRASSRREADGYEGNSGSFEAIVLQGGFEARDDGVLCRGLLV